MHILFIPTTTTTTPKPFTSSSSQPRGSSTPTNPFLLLSSLRWDPPLPSPPPTSLFPSHPNNNPNPLTLPNKNQPTHHLLLTCTPNVPSLIRRPLSPQTNNSQTVLVPKSRPSSTPLRIMDVLLLSSSDSINSVSSLAKTSSMELADGQTDVSYCHKLRCNKSTGHTQPINGPLASFHEMVETHLDPTKELKRLISECKYDEAFTIELQRSDVAIVSRLCIQAFLILSSSVLVDFAGYHVSASSSSRPGREYCSL